MRRLILVIAAVVGVNGLASAQDEGALRVGAAKVEITPPKDAGIGMSGYRNRDQPFDGVHDELYFRAIVIDDGEARAAIVVGDLINIQDWFWQRVTSLIEQQIGIPPSHVLLAATHTHGGPNLSDRLASENPKLAAYIEQTIQHIAGAVKQAAHALQPARMGVGQGYANVNINRRAMLGSGGWWLGNNPDGVSDKTVHVLKFEKLDGQPIAVLVNYGVHGVVLGPRNLKITADLPGACSRYLERHYGDDVVAPWTSGTAGDQNPIYAIEDDFGGRIRPMEILGRILGEEAVRVADSIRTTRHGRIRTAQNVVTCPGKTNPPDATDLARAGKPVKFSDGPPVEIRLSVLMLGNTALCGVSGEVLTNIGLRLKGRSPYAQTMLITNCNGSSGYLADDASYEQVSYEIVTTKAKRGCVETAIVDGLIRMMNEF